MHNKSSKEIIELLKSNESLGLNNEQVEKSQVDNGQNKLESRKKQSLFVKFLLEFKDALIIILLVAAIVPLIVDLHDWLAEGWVDSLIIFVVVIINAILGVYQENKAEKSLEALKKMSSPITKVIRNGEVCQIKTEEVVVGDILMLEAGDIIPADARIIECASLKVDESALTGESLPVEKNAKIIEKEEVAIGDKFNMLFSSTAITNGRAKAIVTSVGMNSEVGKIAGMLLEHGDESTPLQNKLTQVGKVIGIMAIAICAVVFALEILAGELPLSAFKSAAALAVAAIPEGLATVVTIVLAIGVSKLAKENAIVKKLPAVETLGCTSIVCSDKTGTLTQNKMTVVEIYSDTLKKSEEIHKKDIPMVRYFALCSDARIVNEEGEEKRIGDPTEIALIILNNKFGESIEGIERVAEIPFDSERKLMTVVCQIDGRLISITKGAPDNILAISKNAKKEEVLDINKNMGQRALRVLGLGIKEIKEIPNDISTLESDLEFVGLVGMIDPARSEVKGSIAIAKNAGIRSIMITGDHVVTAIAIAEELGILGDGQKAITSQELDLLSDEELFAHIEEYSVYARVAPKDKVRIVNAWQKKGKIVAMTGDGVNDSPALKKAEIGCAMGITGTEVSKEAADMILMDDNFATIIVAVKEGRGIYSNLRKCVKYLLSSNIGEVLAIFLAVLITAIGKNFQISAFELGIPLMAIHLLWINLVTDSLPAFALGMEKPDESIMEEKPREAKEGFFAHKLGLEIIIQGIFIGLITLAAYIIGESQVDKYGQEVAHAIGQTMAFVTLSLIQLFHSFNIKSKKTIFSKTTFNNKTLIYAFIIGFALQMAVVYIPGINDVFKTSALSFPNLAISIGLAMSVIIFSEMMKLVYRIIERKQKNKIKE